MFFVSCSTRRQRNPLVLAPKKSVALQARWEPSAGAAPILGGSDVSVTTPLARQVLPTVAPVPSAGWANVGGQGAPSEVTEQSAMVATPLPMTGRTELPTVLMVPTTVGAMQPVMTPPTQVEVAAAVTGRLQLGAIVVALEELA